MHGTHTHMRVQFQAFADLYFWQKGKKLNLSTLTCQAFYFARMEFRHFFFLLLRIEFGFQMVFEMDGKLVWFNVNLIFVINIAKIVGYMKVKMK